MRRLGLLLVLAACLATSAAAEEFTATFYPQGKREPVLFTQTQTETRSGDTVTGIRRVYFAPDGKEVAVEEVAFEGGKVKTFRFEQKQVNEQGSLEVKDGQVHFSYTADGKTKTDSEALTPDFVVSPLLIAYLRTGWPALLEGKTLKARLAVLDRRETVGFQFTKVGETALNGRAVVLVQMKPSSFIIAALVKSIRLTLDKETARLAEYSGRVVPKQQVNGKWETLDADVVYKY